jgi:ACS family hexuronate transporter-like MFS transporter
MAITFAVNSCWHVFRYWLPPYLQSGLGYSESEMLYFTSVYYVMAAAGCIAAGPASLWLNRRGMSIHNAQSRVFLVCCLLTMLSVTLPLLPGWWKLATLLVIGFGALGLFPCYYSFTQELSVPHQGKITGLLGSFAWVTSSGIHKQFGRLIDATHSYDIGFVLAGTLPLVSFVVLALLWDRSEPTALQADAPARPLSKL